MEPACILIVDDNLINLKIVARLLGFEGYTVITATNAVEAQRVIQTTHPDLILMDISMPGMDGLTLTKLLKERGETRHIPIIALTASATPDYTQRAFEVGCCGFITKPVDIKEFPQQIKAHLGAAPGQG